MNREIIETAILELDQLLKIDSDTEEDYQQWFERNPIVFKVLGFLNYIPHPVIKDISNEEWKPDFLVQATNKNWVIFEIKTPQTKIILDRQRRNSFYASFHSYVSQCKDYSELFDESKTRADFQQRYNIEFLGKRPVSVLVAGRNEGLDRMELIKQSSRESVTSFTYDDIREALEIHRTFYFDSYENSKGYAIFLGVKLHKITPPISNNHIIDMGVYPDKDRISIYLDKRNFLVLDVWDSLGFKYFAKSKHPIANDEFGKIMLLEFEIRSNDEFSFLSITINFKYKADIRTNTFQIDTGNKINLGANPFGRGLTNFEMIELLIFDSTNFTIKTIYRADFTEKILLINSIPTMHLQGRSRMATSSDS